MTIRVALEHSTSYKFDRPVQVHPHVIRLRPAPHCRTPISAYSLKVEPSEHFVNWQQDPFGNHLARFVFPEKTRELKIDVSLIAEMTVINPFDFFLEEAFETFPFHYEPQLAKDLAPYLEVREQGPLLSQWLSSVDPGPTQVVNWLVALNQRLQSDIAYLVRMEAGVQTCEQTLERGSGSCRDSGWLLVQILRHLGLAARFVSGYLVQLTADQKSLDGPSGTSEDFTDLHAWAEVYLPGAGWVGLDATSGLLTGEGHIPLACTPDPASAAPVTGAIDPTEVTFHFSNTVTRIHEDPRVTKPYTDEQWRAVLKLGDKVDAQLSKGKVGLTMGGEPTFVSIDDMEGAEWNYTALSPEKRTLAGQLLLRLRDQYASHAILHFGQAKWYPGEPLPRWALSMFWRTDGVPMLNHPESITHPDHASKANSDDAKRLLEALADQLGIAPERIIPAFEDAEHYRQLEESLPINVETKDAKLEDQLERDRFARLFTEGLEKVVGYVLPLKWLDRGNASHWRSSHWPLRRQRLLLIPGDSPLGLRLPLASLPWEDPEDKELQTQPDPFAPRESLPNPDTAARAPSDPDDRLIIHTALCAQVREQRLFVFLPPNDELSVYLDLLNQIASVAQRLGLQVVIEGYEPPRDPRLQILQITPDPGVIEVNVHPASDWPSLVEQTTTLYEAARQCRLGTEKFMLDGRHSGTGGGNHVTLGAAEPVNSPFLRRPDLLRSLITYWQRHPSLSYLFSGMFIGPTSQAPRVDEARDDNLYELEIAFDLLPDGESERLWMVDRLLRNFLIDLTGNTHRAEFSIDKLYSPDGPTGRKGLVELRAMEMPPHAQMSLVQMLLIRAMVARFWRKPYRKPLIRWGTQLHDRFMLRHFIWQDLLDVLTDLRASGYGFADEWFAPFCEFRFPLVGRFVARGMEVEIHTALEPWHVLGEEASAQGTSRYVDSSVERLQVSVQGLPGDRYTILCNGRPIPLRPTGEQGSAVGAVRFKAWKQHSSLHPTIDVHTPLTFDLVDVANKRSIAGATYHVAHPGGRNYDTFPLNANEAEARRAVRFSAHGGTQGQIRLQSEQPHPDQPFTLDLRTQPRR